jgi:hypothetical protein
MPISKEELSRQLAALEYRHTCCNGAELRHLPKVLREGERLRALARGVHDGSRWLMAATDQRLLLLDKGIFYRLKMVELPLREIQTVQHQTGALQGELSITTASGVRRISKLRRRAALVIADILSQQIAALGARAAPAGPAAAGTEERLSSLERLQKLRDSGVLTPEEFAAEKEKILRQR